MKARILFVAVIALVCCFSPTALTADDTSQNSPKGAKEGRTGGDEMVRVMRDRLAKMSELLSKRINRLGDTDLVSQDLLIAVKADIDKYHWQFAVQLLK